MSRWSATWGRGVALLAVLGVLVLSGAAGAEVLGQVVAVQGHSVAELPGEAPRSLACDDVVHEGETLVTSPAAGVGFVADDVYVQLDADARLRLTTEEGAASLALVAGGLRVVDIRARDAAPWRLTTPEAELRAGAGVDAEAWARPGETHLCVHEGSVAVAPAAGIPVDLPAGACARVDARKVAHVAGAAPEIAVADALSCRFDVTGLADLFTPTDVASPPLAVGFPAVGAADLFRRDACDNPGSGCAGSPMPVPPAAPPPTPPPGPPIFVDPDPDIGCGGPGFPC
jgi:hypothetical protein